MTRTFLVLLLAAFAASFGRVAVAQDTTCKISFRGLSLATRTNAAGGAGRASIACTGASLQIIVAPALRPFVADFRGARCHERRGA